MKKTQWVQWCVATAIAAVFGSLTTVISMAAFAGDTFYFRKEGEKLEKSVSEVREDHKDDSKKFDRKIDDLHKDVKEILKEIGRLRR